MTESRPAGPLPGPARPAVSSGACSAEGESPAEGALPPVADEPPCATPFGALAHRPVAEHVGLFEAEHARLQRELGTIDQV